MKRALFLVTFAIVVFFLTVDSIIGYVSDFLVKQNTSSLGISLFASICVVFVIASFVIYQLIKGTTSEVRSNSIELRVLHSTTFVTQLVLIVVLVALLVHRFFLRILYSISYLNCSGKPNRSCICDDHSLLDPSYLVSIQQRIICSPHFRIGILDQHLCLHLHFYR